MEIEAAGGLRYVGCVCRKALAKADIFFLRALSAFDALTRSEEYIHHENVDFPAPRLWFHGLILGKTVGEDNSAVECSPPPTIRLPSHSTEELPNFFARSGLIIVAYKFDAGGFVANQDAASGCGFVRSGSCRWRRSSTIVTCISRARRTTFCRSFLMNMGSQAERLGQSI